MFSADDSRHMARALTLAARGRETAHPNPMVGTVLVRDGEVVGEGWHEKTGEPHAEINALDAAGERARGGVRADDAAAVEVVVAEHEVDRAPDLALEHREVGREPRRGREVAGDDDRVGPGPRERVRERRH